MTGHVCPECGVHRPGCACARAELAAAEDFDPLRIRPYVTLDAPEGSGAGTDAYGAGRGVHGVDAGARGTEAGPYGAEAGAYGGAAGAYGTGPGAYGSEAGPHGAGTGTYGAGGADADPPTARLAAIRPDAPEGHPYGTGPYGTDAGADPSETMPLLLRGPGEEIGRAHV